MANSPVHLFVPFENCPADKRLDEATRTAMFVQRAIGPGVEGNLFLISKYHRLSSDIRNSTSFLFYQKSELSPISGPVSSKLTYLGNSSHQRNDSDQWAEFIIPVALVVERGNTYLTIIYINWVQKLKSKEIANLAWRIMKNLYKETVGNWVWYIW